MTTKKWRPPSQKELQAVMREHKTAAFTAHERSRLAGQPYLNLRYGVFLLEPFPAPIGDQRLAVFCRDFATGRMIGSFNTKEAAKQAIDKAADVVDEWEPVIPKQEYL